MWQSRRGAPDAPADSEPKGAVVSIELLADLRERVLPMLAVAAENYHRRVPEGYPVVVDAVDNGVVGLELDPSYALYFTTDGADLFAQLYRRSPRTDALSSAGRQKESGLPVLDRRPLSPTVSDQGLRNLVNELMLYWNQQPGIIHISDS
jgi:hypothetical protein